MAGEWREIAWGDLATLEYGKSIRGYENANGPYRVFGTNGPIGWHSEPLSRHGTVVVGRKGAYRGIHYSAEPCFIIDTAFFLKPRIEFDMRWAYYALLTQDINGMDSGSAIPSTSRNDFYLLPVNVPSDVKEQRAIAHILGTLDDKIEVNRRMNATLEAMARALFTSWFVDFDPVRAKAEGRQPEGMAAATAALFPADFEDSEHGEIPQGWKVSQFSETIEIIGGGTPKTSKPEYWNGAIPWFSVADAPMDADVFVIDTGKTITQEGLANSSAQLLPEGTTIISARGTVGKVALIGRPMAMNQSCYGLRGTFGEHGYFTYFSTRNLVTILQQHSHGSVFNTITRDTLAGVRVAVPSPQIIENYELRVAPLMMQILENVYESRILSALRDALLPKLISGELRVDRGSA